MKMNNLSMVGRPSLAALIRAGTEARSTRSFSYKA